MKKSEMKKLNLDALKEAEFTRAKDWANKANYANGTVIAMGLVANIWPQSAPAVALLSAISLAFSTFSQWWSDNAKNNSEWLLRQFEMWDGMGWPIDEVQLSYLLSGLPVDVRDRIDDGSDGKYFDSKKKTSARRMADNIRQSAFYTRCQARFIAGAILAVGVLVIGVTFVLAILAFQNLRSNGGLEIAYILMTIFQIVVGTNYLRFAMDYWQFAPVAGRIEERAEALARNKATSEVEAIRLAHDYQIARASLPLIPEWVWKVKQDEINALWMKLRNGD
jgi:hypothetical protein